MAIVTQKKAFKPGKWKGKLFTADRLKQFAESTNAAIKAGVSIPALLNHAKPGADDAETAKLAESEEHGAGWLKGVEFDPADGTIGYQLDIPKSIASEIENGTIKFTSPEFRDEYDPADVPFKGPVIRHVAFTPKPYLQDQGALALAFSEGIYQFGEDDYEGPADDKADPPPAGDPPPKEKNPDSPPKATDKTKTAALVEGMAQLGVVLPSDFDLSNDNALDLMITGLNTAIKAKSDAEANKPKEPEQPEVKESNSGMPFSEEDISVLPEPLQVKARKANDAAKAAADQALQFAEERATANRNEAVASIKSAKLPPALRKQLIELVENTEAVQFSEEGEKPTLTVQRVAQMFADAIPPSLRFSEDELTDSAHPEGEAFFKPQGAAETEEEADAIADRVFGKKQKAA